MIGTTIRKRELYEAFLRGVPIFNTLTHEEILTVADALQPVSRRRFLLRTPQQMHYC